MTNSQKLIILILVILLVVLFVGGIVFINRYFEMPPKNVLLPTADSPAQTTATSAVILPTQTEVVVEVVATSVPSPTLSPSEPTPVMQEYKFAGIDLGSGRQTALTFVLPDGQIVTSTWASAIAYRAGDDSAVVFGPGAGTIYTHTRDTVATWLHSGTWSGNKIFATDLERYLRMDGSLTIEESQLRLDSLREADVYLCQLNDGAGTNGLVCLPGDPNLPGKVVHLRVAAAVVVPHEMVGDYETNAGQMASWLAQTFPGKGFDQLSLKDSWMVKTCVGMLDGQEGDGTPGYLFNRLAIGFVLAE